MVQITYVLYKNKEMNFNNKISNSYKQIIFEGISFKSDNISQDFEMIIVTREQFAKSYFSCVMGQMMEKNQKNFVVQNYLFEQKSIYFNILQAFRVTTDIFP